MPSTLLICGSLEGSQRSLSASGAHTLLGCTIYVSEGRCKSTIDKLKAIAEQQSDTALAASFVDKPYNRTSFTIIGRKPAKVASSIVGIAVAAVRMLNLQTHAASHPRLGVVDHISCHPLQPWEDLGAAIALARCIAAGVACQFPDLPIILYGGASTSGTKLRDVRRACGYFKGASSGSWVGTEGMTVGMQPEHGPQAVHPHLGMCTIGAVPWIVNFNIVLAGLELAHGRAICKELGERGGGLPCVEAMALRHDQGTEIACNLLDYHVTSPEAVLAKTAELVAGHPGASICSSYVIGKPVPDLVSLAQQLSL